MPLQNRVLPTGEIVAHPARGLLMGNRGCIHLPDRTLGTARWRTKMWISCLLTFKDKHRDVMPPGRYTALFFLDEPTALAAGHRPCGECRRADYRWFVEAWQAGQGLAERPRAAEIDRVLHAERVEPRTRRPITRSVLADRLPAGAMISHGGTIGLWCGGALLPWSLEGYGQTVRVAAGTPVILLTPPSVVAALRAGYRPLVHPSAGQTPLRAFPRPVLTSAAS